jgi:hypothetical protein
MKLTRNGSSESHRISLYEPFGSEEKTCAQMLNDIKICKERSKKRNKNFL